ncbi:hypothetical protein BJ912DRAFT_1148563 [Pholiota molesta]|nr:hypothetical protein BJ912DRAFT_1148563 [Pholiota molesta]
MQIRSIGSLRVQNPSVNSQLCLPRRSAVPLENIRPDHSRAGWMTDGKDASVDALGSASGPWAHVGDDRVDLNTAAGRDRAALDAANVNVAHIRATSLTQPSCAVALRGSKSGIRVYALGNSGSGQRHCGHCSSLLVSQAEKDLASGVTEKRSGEEAVLTRMCNPISQEQERKEDVEDEPEKPKDDIHILILELDWFPLPPAANRAATRLESHQSESSPPSPPMHPCLRGTEAASWIQRTHMD